MYVAAFKKLTNIKSLCYTPKTLITIISQLYMCMYACTCVCVHSFKKKRSVTQPETQRQQQAGGDSQTLENLPVASGSPGGALLDAQFSGPDLWRI